MRLVEFSVKNSLLVNLLSVVIILAGLFAIGSLQREAFPNIAFDTVMIQTTYPGSTSNEVEKLVTIPIEEELNEVDGIDKITSISVQGRSVISVELDPDASDKSDIVNDIQRAVDRTEDLPADAQDPVVEELETKDQPIIIVSLTGPDFWEVRKIARILEEEIEEVSGVARVDRDDWPDTQIWVEVQPEKLSDIHLSLDEIRRALSSRNLNLPGGKVMVDGQQYVIRTLGEFETPEDIEQVIIRANEQGNWLRVGEVATVRYALEDNDRYDKMNGVRSVNLIVVKKERADTLQVAEKVQDFVETFAAKQKGEVTISAFEDLTLGYVRRRLGILINNLSVGIVFLTLVLILFLNLRVALLTAMGIPLAAMVTFALMAFFGKSINLLSMFGFIIVLGMLVDDGIVVAENSFRYIEQGMSASAAAVRGASEVLAPVTATILTTIAFFAPLMMMSGIIGKFVAIIPFVVIAALLASWLECLFILPSHIADFAQSKREGKRKPISKQLWFKRLRKRYMEIVKAALRKRWWVLAGVGVATLLTIVLYLTCMRFSLFPPAGSLNFFIRVEAPAGTSLKELDARIQKIEAVLAKLPKQDVSHFITELGIQREDMEDPAVRREPNLGQIRVYLTSSRARKRDAQDILKDVKRDMPEIEGMDISYELMRTGPPVGKPIEAHIRGEDFVQLEKVAEEFKAYLEGLEGVSDVRDNYEPSKPEFHVVVVEEAAKTAGLSVTDIATTMRMAFEGLEATTIKRTDEEIKVMVRFPESAQADIDQLDYLMVENSRGNLVPLRKLVRLEKSEGLSFIKHLDRKRDVTVSADINERVITSNQVHTLLHEKFGDIPIRFPGVSVRYGGEQEKTNESMAGLKKAFIIAIMIQYVILAATFGSLIHPFVVMSAIPLGLLGVVWAFFFHGEYLSFMAFLGTIGLSGVVLNDSIVLVSFVNRMRASGASMKRAILSAGFLRFRPVLLTTITTVVGLAPVAYGIGGLDPFLKPAALAMVWGLVVATALTLIMIPCVYAMIEDIHQFCRENVKVRGWENA